MTAIAPRTARAAQYEILIDVRNDEELQELFATGQIEEETWNTLVQLMARGVNLDTASRADIYALPNITYDEVDLILAYREEAGTIGDPAGLVAAGALTRERLEQIAPFLTVGDGFEPLGATNGYVRLQAAGSPADNVAPTTALQFRLTTLRHLQLGGALLTNRQRIGSVRYDPTRDALSGEGQRYRLQAPKLFARYGDNHYEVILGTFRAGFGQRLTFDNSDRFTPNGLYVDNAVFWDPGMSTRCRETSGELGATPCDTNVRVTNDFRARAGLMGVAAGMRDIAVGTGTLQAYAFFSYQPQSIYQFQTYDRGACDDPRTADDECSSIRIYNRSDGNADNTVPQSTFTQMTIDRAYLEMLGGGNVTYFFNRRSHIGLTGYAARADWLIDGIDIDFQDWASRPFGRGPYGAVGLDASYGHDWLDLFLEVTRTFDSQETDDGVGGGGFGTIARGTATWDRNEVELVLRYYGRDFANPYGRPIAAPDQFDGNRARDEIGGRVRFTGLIGDSFRLRASADVWTQPTRRQPKMQAFVRGDYQVSEALNLGLWLEYQNNDLTSFRDHAQFGPDDDMDGEPDVLGRTCFSGTVDNDDNGEPVQCGGEQIEITPRIGIRFSRRYSLTVQYQHQILDDGTSRYNGSYRQDASAFAIFRANPVDPLRFVARVRYLNEGLGNADYLEQSLWYYVSGAYRFDSGLTFTLRYDVYHYLDDRDNTAARTPNPEHWARLELMQRF